MTLEQTLIKAGLDEKQARIYLAGLELGAATVLQISKKSGVKRPTTYVLLDQMVEEGYFSKSAGAGRPQYVAANPADLLRRVHEREETLKSSLPELLAIMATTKTRPKITIYEGVRGMYQVYDEIFKSTEIHWFGSFREITARFPDLVERSIEAARTHHTRVWDLVTDDPGSHAYAQKAASPNYTTKFLPKESKVFIDSGIFGDKVAIFALSRDLFAVVIESKEVADSFRTLHALAWAGARPVEEVVSS